MDVVRPVILESVEQGKMVMADQTATKTVTVKVFRILEFSDFMLINVQLAD